MDFFQHFNLDVKDLSLAGKLQLLRLFNCFAKISYLKQDPDSGITTLSCRNEEDLVNLRLTACLGDDVPPAYIQMYDYLKENYCQEVLEDGGVYPSQEYLCKLYPEVLRRFLPFSRPVLNCNPPFPVEARCKINNVLSSLNIQSVCDKTANGGDIRVMLSSVLSWMVQENNSVEEDPKDYVLFDAVLDYDFLYSFGGVYMPMIEEDANLRTDKYVLVITHLDDYQEEYLTGGRLVSVQLIDWNKRKEDEVYLLAFDMRGGHDKVQYPEGKSFSYQEILANGGKLDYASVGIVVTPKVPKPPKPIGWKPTKLD